jgi:hypothetical protein
MTARLASWEWPEFLRRRIAADPELNPSLVCIEADPIPNPSHPIVCIDLTEEMDISPPASPTRQAWDRDEIDYERFEFPRLWTLLPPPVFPEEALLDDPDEWCF